jgi:hypothetical protein
MTKKNRATELAVTNTELSKNKRKEKRAIELISQ